MVLVVAVCVVLPALQLLRNMHSRISPLGFGVHIGKDASADSFYDSQGRIGTMFDDDNADLLKV